MLLLAAVRFFVWEAALLALAVRVADRFRATGAERWLLIISTQVTLSASVAGLLSFAGLNRPWIYGAIAILGLAAVQRVKLGSFRYPGDAAVLAALVVPLILLAFRPVEEIDSINYLHYLIEWMANRATPYTFATNYVAFWELSFLPAWIVSGIDGFFPWVALKAVAVVALALWLLGRELGLDGALLRWTIFGALSMRHFWYEYSGVPTLKNDVLHGAGFVILTLVTVRAARRSLTASDVALLAFGGAFALVKYTGIFAAGLAMAAIAVLQRRHLRAPAIVAIAAVVMLTSGHYYLHNLWAYGSPFYPFQINLGPIHLPGTADLSNTSILLSVGDPRVWQTLFLPKGGLSPAGLLFPLTLAAGLAMALWRAIRGSLPMRITAICLLIGWLLYFRSVYSASASAGDLAFLLNSLNSLRYVDGVLAATELFLVLQLPSVAAFTLVSINLASRLWILYPHLPLTLFSPAVILVLSAAVLLAILRLHPRVIAAGCLFAATPWLVERNRVQWTPYWNDLKPALAAARGGGLTELALEDGGYFAGHVIAAGNPVDPSVRSVLPDDFQPATPFLALLVTTGSEAARDWHARYAARIAAWGYRPKTEGAFGTLYERGQTR